MASPHKRRLGQDVVDEVKTRFTKGKLHLLLARRLALQEDQAPQDSPAAVHVDASRNLLDNQAGAHMWYVFRLAQMLLQVR